MTGVEIAIRKAGGMRALARKIGVTYQSIQKWDEVPVRWLFAVERATGIPAHKLRPELYRDYKRIKELEPA